MNTKVMFTICLVASVALIVGGFIVPPTGVIDGSVLTAVGELLGFGAISMIPEMISKGTNFKVTHNNTTLEVNNDEDGEDTDPC